MRIIFLIGLFLLKTLAVQAQKDTLASNHWNYLAISHEYATFDKDLRDWNTTTLEGRFLKNSWSIIPRFIYSSRFGQSGVLLEQDIYKTFRSKDYLLLHAGIASSPIFYQFKLAGEYFNPFSKSWEHSIGLRYTQFNDSLYIGSVSGSLSKYSGSFLAIAKATLGFIQQGVAISTVNINTTLRRYHSDNEYWAIFAGYGYDPNTLLMATNKNLLLQHSTRSMNIGLMTLQQIAQRMMLSCQIEYQYYDFGFSQRKQFKGAIQLIYRI